MNQPAAWLSLLLVVAFSPVAVAQRQMESLNRGLVAVQQAGHGTYVGWRLLGTDPPDVAFNLYRVTRGGTPRRLNESPLDGATNFLDADADLPRGAEYFLRPVVDGRELAPSQRVAAWENQFLEIPIQPLEGYRPGDASVADLDGDGELEIVLHQTRNGRDNAFAGLTGTPILDAYDLDGTHLWRIDLGQNIREGEHYTQFMVYDLDGDGRAELACKTADGTVDGRGKVIGDLDRDWRNLDENSPRYGRILEGPEYFTIFDGPTGRALQTVDYIPARNPVDGWGGIGGNAGNDNYGNRCDRFLACVAYLDGKRPSVVMCRGVYGRIVMAAWDWRKAELASRWVFDSGISYPPFDDASPYSGMGGHSLAVADVDGDGRDEIVYQAMVVDDDGQGLYSTGLRHGDSMHISDMYPDRPGMEVFTIQENEENAELFRTPAAAMRDAETGEVLWSHSPEVDVGSGMAADVDPSHLGYEAWGGPGGLRDTRGDSLGPAPREKDWCLWWDGDLLRELIATGRQWRPRRTGRTPLRDAQPSSARESRRRTPPGVRVRKWDWEANTSETIFVAEGYPAGRGPSLVGDLIGDWREEMLLVAPGGGALRLYTTTDMTEHRLVTLLHDPQYRLGIAWQNVVYNKPSHPGFYLGSGMADPPRPHIQAVGRRSSTGGAVEDQP